MDPSLEAYRRLAAAVVHRAMKDAIGQSVSSRGIREAREFTIQARQWLQGDLEPYGSIIDLDPWTDQGFRDWLRVHDMEPCSRLGGRRP